MGWNHAEVNGPPAADIWILKTIDMSEIRCYLKSIEKNKKSIINYIVTWNGLSFKMFRMSPIQRRCCCSQCELVFTSVSEVRKVLPSGLSAESKLTRCLKTPPGSKVHHLIILLSSQLRSAFHSSNASHISPLAVIHLKMPLKGCIFPNT